MLGFGGFREFQSAFRQLARQPMSRVSRVRMVAGGAARWPTWPTRSSRTTSKTSRRTRRTLDQCLLLAAADRIWQARRLYLLGKRSAHSVALLLHFALRLLGRDSRLMTPGIGDLPGQLLEVSDRDVAVGISFERYAKISLELFDTCVDCGATGIAITDKASSPLTRKAALVIRCQIR